MTTPESYAWVPPVHHFTEPVRATRCTQPGKHSLWDTVLDLHPKAGFVQDLPKIEVVLHHPDVGEIQSLVTQQDLRGNWRELPPHSLVEVTGWDPDKSWEQVAEERYRWVCEQRALADRLTALGVPRCRRHYAGQGGTSSDVRYQMDTSLVLNNNELRTLVELAERGNT